MRKFGIEIEAGGVEADHLVNRLLAAGITVYNRRGAYGYSQRQGGWQVTYDSTIRLQHGFELISPPLCGDEGLAEVEKVCKVLAECGATVNESCGMHVHVDGADLNLEQMKNLFRLFTKFEPCFDELVSPSRRASGSDFARTVRGALGTTLPAAFERINEMRRVDDFSSYVSRYSKLNPHALLRHGTVEIRMHNGTICAKKILPWIALCVGMVERAASVRCVKCQPPNFTNLARWAGKYSRSLHSRRAKLRTNAGAAVA